MVRRGPKSWVWRGCLVPSVWAFRCVGGLAGRLAHHYPSSAPAIRFFWRRLCMVSMCMVVSDSALWHLGVFARPPCSKQLQRSCFQRPQARPWIKHPNVASLKEKGRDSARWLPGGEGLGTIWATTLCWPLAVVVTTSTPVRLVVPLREEARESTTSRAAGGQIGSPNKRGANPPLWGNRCKKSQILAQAK